MFEQRVEFLQIALTVGFFVIFLFGTDPLVFVRVLSFYYDDTIGDRVMSVALWFMTALGLYPLGYVIYGAICG